MAEAKLALIVDGTGARREIKLTNEELVKLANGGKLASESLKQVGAPQTVTHMARVTQALEIQNRTVTNATPGLHKLQNSLGNAAVALANIPGPAGRVASALGQFAIGGGLTVGVLAGVAAISLAWREFTKDADAAKKMMEDLHEMEAKFSGGALHARLRSVEIEREQLLRKQMNSGRALGTNMDGSTRFAPTFTGADLKRLDEVQKHYGELSVAVNKLDRDLASSNAEEELERFAKAAETLREPLTDFIASMDRDVAQGIKDFAKRLADAADEVERFNKAFRDPTVGAFGGVAKEDLQQIADGVGKVAQKLLDAAEAAKRLKEQQAAARKDMLISGAIGIAGRFSPELGGIASGAYAGFMAGGPQGAAIGAGMALVDTLFGLADSGKRAHEAFRQWQLQFAEFVASEKEALGIISGVDARVGQLNKAYAEYRKNLELQIALAESFGKTAVALRGQLEVLNKLEKDRIIQIQTESKKALQDELEVRRLLVLGQTEAAAALRLRLEHEKEYADAVKAGADALDLATLAEVQRAEKMNLAMANVQQRIDSITATIGGLADFRNSLLLADTQSPVERLAEARRQYAGILTTAQNGELEQAQAAAARLPAAAQTLLDLSRLVNASGADFQKDFKSVLDDTQGLITRFVDLRSIEELMLEELRRIRDGVEGEIEIERERDRRGGIAGGGRPRTGSTGTGALTSEASDDSDPLITVTRAGFIELSEKVDRLADAVDASSRETRRAVTALT